MRDATSFSCLIKFAIFGGEVDEIVEHQHLDRRRGASDSVASRGRIGVPPGATQVVPQEGGPPGGPRKGGPGGGPRGGCRNPRFCTLCTISPKRPSHLRSSGPICLIIRGAPTPPSPGGTPPPGGCFGGLFRGRFRVPGAQVDTPQI